MLALRARILLVATSTLLLLACGDSGRATASDSAGSSSVSVGSITLTNGGTAAPTEGGASETAGTGGTGGATGSASTPTTDASMSASASDSAPKFDIGNTPDASVGCGDSGGGMLDTSYIWIPSTSDGWVSKIKTLRAANCGVYGRIQAVG